MNVMYSLAFTTQLLGFLSSEDEYACLEACKALPYCAWFTFDPDQEHFCALLETCDELDLQQCPSCISGEI